MLAVVMCFVITACGTSNISCYDNTGFAKLENQFASYEVDVTEVPNGVIYEYTLVLLQGEESVYDPVAYEEILSSYEIRDKAEDTIAWGKTLPEYIGEDPTDLTLSEYVDDNGNVMVVTQGFSSNSNSYTICIRYAD